MGAQPGAWGSVLVLGREVPWGAVQKPIAAILGSLEVELFIGMNPVVEALPGATGWIRALCSVQSGGEKPSATGPRDLCSTSGSFMVSDDAVHAGS